MKIKEEFILSDVELVLKEDVTCVILGTNSEEARCQEIKTRFEGTKAKLVKIDYDHDAGRFSFSAVGDPLVQRPIKEHFAKNFANFIRGFEKNVLVDITSLQHPVIIAVLNSLCNDIKPAHLFVSYVKPERYITRNELGKYNLSTCVYDSDGVPGMIRQRKEHEILIPFLGFEGDRLRNIVDTMEYDAIIPVIGFPSEDPSWKFESLRNCMQVLETNCPEAEIRKCSSNSIYDAIFMLEEIKRDNPENNFVLLPLGIRAHTAACAIWAAQNKKISRILYDYAVESSERSTGIGETMIYHISRFIN